MKISLACIAYNVERYLPRFLDCFQPHVDEVVIVRAIGAAKPDKTLQIAIDRGCVVGEYANQHFPEWDHCDDWAAARNKAFELAAGEWIMWADTDDVISPEDGAKLRPAIESLESDCDGLIVPYSVPSDGLVPMRERVMRRGAGRWQHRIHEFYKFAKESPRLAKSDHILIRHAQDDDRSSNDQRNLRVLQSIPAGEMTSSLRFHMFQALRACGRKEEAIEAALVAVQHKDTGPNEKYELLISLGQLADELPQRAQLYLQALAIDPSRREAYGELALCSVAMGEPSNAAGWVSAMHGIGKPQEFQWNARRKYYSWLGEHIRGMVLRANNRYVEANTRELNMFAQAGGKISLIHATRGRPQQAFKCAAEWFERADNPEAIEHIFCIDRDDPDGQQLAVRRCLYNDGIGSVGAWNTAAAVSSGKVLVQLSDDWVPPRGWDTAILAELGDLDRPAVLAVSDGVRRDDLLCMAIMTRARWVQQGRAMFHPDFFSVYSDNWFSHCAFRDGVVVDARGRLVFEHNHPAFGKAKMDSTYMRGNSDVAYITGKRHCDRLLAGVRTSWDVHGWCNYRLFYTSVANAIQAGPEPETFVEVGAWMGQSAIHLAQRLQDLGKTHVQVVCIDTWEGEKEQPEHQPIIEAHGGSIKAVFDANVAAAQVGDVIEAVVSDSAKGAALFADKSISGVFIDAAHDYESVKRDLAAWWPKVRDGGIFSGHDYDWHEVKRAVDEHAAANGWEIGTVGNVWVKNERLFSVRATGANPVLF